MSLFGLRSIFMTAIAACLCQAVSATDVPRREALREELHQLLRPYRARVGIALCTDTGDTLTVNGAGAYPVMSVFKAPVAMAVLKRMEQKGVKLNQLVPMQQHDFKTGTYSPMRQRYAANTAQLPLDTLLYYSVSLSDNNACDRLIAYAGGIDKVQSLVRKMHVNGWTLKATEDDMHRGTLRQADNTGTPLGVATLFHRIVKEPWIKTYYKDYLLRLLELSPTGADKLRAGLPQGVVMGHKTGSSDRLLDGRKLGDNDAGYVYLPNGGFYTLAVLVTDSYEDDATNAKLIASVSRLIYGRMSAQNQ